MTLADTVALTTYLHRLSCSSKLSLLFTFHSSTLSLCHPRLEVLQLIYFTIFYSFLSACITFIYTLTVRYILLPLTSIPLLGSAFFPPSLQFFFLPACSLPSPQITASSANITVTDPPARPYLSTCPSPLQTRGGSELIRNEAPVLLFSLMPRTILTQPSVISDLRGSLGLL